MYIFSGFFDEGYYLCRPCWNIYRDTAGGVAERLNAPVLKTGVLERVPGVRIPPPPQRIERFQ